MNSLEHIYSKEPVSYEDGIPCFSINDKYIDNYDKIASDHLKVLDTTGVNPFMPENVLNDLEEATRKFIKSYIKEDSKILDVGVSLGRLLKPLTNIQRYGMDISIEYLKRTKLLGINVCQSSIEDMPYHKDFFDIITCTDCLEHVVDLNLCCSKIISVLKPGGYLIIRVPYKESLQHYLLPNYKYEFAHLRNFDEFSLCLLFTKIFNCDFEKYHKVGYYRDYSRLKYPIKDELILLCIDKLLNILKKISNNIYEMLIEKLFNPLDIIFVVRKPC